MAGPSTSAATGSDRVVTLADGRAVSLMEHGDPEGWPVLCLHGTPASRLGFGYTDGPARALGLRVLCPDRPGVGRSTLSPLPSVGAYAAADLAALADALSLPRFAVLGYSGGGPYALAAAMLLRDRVDAVATMAGVAPLDWPGSTAGLQPAEVRLARWTLSHPHRARAVLRGAALAIRRTPGLAARSFASSLGDADRAALERMDVAHGGFAFAAEAFRQGVDGVFGDYRRWVAPWGFRLGATPLPVHLWQGDDQHVVPLAHADHLATMVPGSVEHRVRGAGHVSIQEAVADVLTSLRPPPGSGPGSSSRR